MKHLLVMTHASAIPPEEERWPPQVLRVGHYRVDVRARRIIGEGGEVRVEPKVMEVFCCLAERPGEVVSKEEFMEEVWSDAIVTDDALLRCIAELRKAFGDDAQRPEYIETIRSQGYRLIAPLREEEAPPEEQPGQEMADASPPANPVLLPEALAPSTESWKGWALLLAVVALAAAGVLSWASRSSTSSIEPLRAVPLTSLRGEEVDPALSPDGERVVFARRRQSSEAYDLYLKERGHELPRRLTDTPTEDRHPAFSPDGRRIAFVREEGAETSIAIVPVTGGPPRRVKTLRTRDVQKLAWSPDGRTLAFSAHEAPYEPFSLFSFSLETLEVQKLTAPASDARGDFAPAFSPDGEHLAFMRSPVSHIADVFVVPVRGEGDVRRLTTDNADITGLDWTPDGENIVFSSDRAGEYGLWQVPSEGGSPRWVATTHSGTLHQPTMARARRALVYVRRSDETNIWKKTLAGENARADSLAAVSIISSTRHETDPTLSPDGRRLAFVSDRTGSDQLWTADASGAHPTRLTNFEGHVTTSPRWSPEGRRLAFDTRQEGSADIYVIGANGGTPRRLTSSRSNDKVPRWSRDGTSIYFASNRSGHWQVWKTAADGTGEAVQVTTEGGFAAREGPKGRYLYYTKRNAPGLWRCALEGGRERRIASDLDPYDGVEWTVQGDSLYYERRSPRPVLVRRALAGDSEAEVVATLERAAYGSSIALSPGARWVFYAREDRRQSDLMFVDSF